MLKKDINTSITLAAVLLTLAGCGDLFAVRKVNLSKEDIRKTCEYSIKCYSSMKNMATMGSRKNVLKTCTDTRQDLLGKRVPETCLQDIDNETGCDQGKKVPPSCNESLDLND